MALDALFAESCSYFQGLEARGNYLLKEATRSWSNFRAQQAVFIANNLRDPTDVADVLVSQYGQYLRPADVYLLRQAQENIGILLSGIRTASFQAKEPLEQMLSNLLEESARRSWLVYRIASRNDSPFTQAAYNQLVGELNATNDKRLRSVKHFKPSVA